jgi:hypothetical protein
MQLSSFVWRLRDSDHGLHVRPFQRRDVPVCFLQFMASRCGIARVGDVAQDIGEVRPLFREAMVARSDAAATPVEPAVIHVRARVVITLTIER